MNTSYSTRKNALTGILSALRARAALPLCLLALIACGAQPALAADKTGAKIIRGDALFSKNCAVCHGDRGNGISRASANLNPKPRDFSTSAYLTRDAMINGVTYGRPGTAMMAWKTRFSPAEIEAIVDYIRGRFMLTALDPRIAQGKLVYEHFCLVCHGDRGQGTKSSEMAGTPRDLQTQTGLGRERLIASITKGRHGPVTAGFSERVPPQNIEAAADYVRQVLLGDLAPAPASALPIAAPQRAAPAQKPASNSPPTAITQADMSQPMPKGLIGDIKSGEKFFKGNCAACHGKLGNGKGPRAYFLNPRPRNFHDSYSRTNLNRPTLFSVISTGKLGTVMPAWNKVLSEQEIANVSEFVFTAFVQEKSQTKAKSDKK